MQYSDFETPSAFLAGFDRLMCRRWLYVYWRTLVITVQCKPDRRDQVLGSVLWFEYIANQTHSLSMSPC